MQSRTDIALACFDEGFNCAQAVLAAFCEQHGLERKAAMKLACGLGGGCRMGELCGAVSGGVLAIGLKHGADDPLDDYAKVACYRLTKEFLKKFHALNGALTCRELLRAASEQPDEMDGESLDALFHMICEEMVASAVELLEELGL